jgi:hypothetical protein
MYIHVRTPLRYPACVCSVGTMNIKMKSIALVACVVAALTGCTTTTTTTSHVPTATTTVYAGVQLPTAISAAIDASGVLVPCPTEDSDNCYWDAVSRSNGVGSSFVAWEGKVYYAH